MKRRRAQARELARQFLSSELWYAPEAIENSPDHVRAAGENARLNAAEMYTNAFVERAVQEFQW